MALFDTLGFTSDDYKITRITFSTKEITTTSVGYPAPSEDQDAPGDFGGSTVEVWITAHVSYLFRGEVGGAFEQNIQKVLTIEYNADGNATSYTEETIPTKTYANIVTLVKDAVETTIANNYVISSKDGARRRALSKFNSIEGISQIY